MDYKIPLFDLNYDTLEEDAVIETLRSKWISTGPKCAEFETAFSNALNSEYALTTSNCTVALHLAFKVLGIGPGDEVICPSLTFVATANAIRYVEATPVFADVKGYEDLTIDPVDIKKKITSKTKAIIVMHYGGFPVDMDAIMDIARQHDLKVVEDACHGPLSEYNGQKLGTIGDIGCFSFFSNKNLSTGEGGMLVTNNSLYFEKAKLLRSHGMTSLSYERSKGHATRYDVVDAGYNYRMDDIRASIGLVQLGKLQKDIELRGIVRQYYLDYLNGLESIIIPFQKVESFASNYIFPIILRNSTAEKRDAVRDHLHQMGIQTSVHYPAVHKFTIYKDFDADLPKTEYVEDNLITLPMYSKLSKQNVKIICDEVIAILGAN